MLWCTKPEYEKKFSPNTYYPLNNHSLKWFRGTTKRTRGRILKLSWYNRSSLQHGFAGFSCQWQMLVGTNAHSVDAPLQTHQSQFNNPQAPIQIPCGISGRPQLALLPVPNHFVLPHRKILNLYLIQSLWLWTPSLCPASFSLFPTFHQTLSLQNSWDKKWLSEKLGEQDNLK